MSRRFRVILLALLALSVALGPVAAGGATPSAIGAADATQTTETPTETIPPETTAITIELQNNGDAIWTIETRIDASTDDEREAFRTMAERYERGEQSPPWLDRARAAAAAASDATDRPMNVTDSEISSNVTTSTLQVRFTWTSFSRAEGDNMVVDDAFNTTRGTWLNGLTESQQLTIELPEGNAVVSAPKGAIVQNARVQWQGPQQFDRGYMRIVYSGDDGPQTTATPEDRDGLLWGGFVVLGLGILAVGAYVFSRRRGGLPAPATDDDPDAPASGTPPPDPDAVGDAGTATAGAVAPEATDDVDEELLSDEERVERLLESNGGRMKQANIVTETGWSNAKVSQLLSSMAEEGTINKLRIGRENLISFPEEDVTDIDQN